jgi:pSer/pThr/pTyr-binding forkhead associated (FHA) protein
VAFKFCGSCGARLEDVGASESMTDVVPEPSVGELILIYPDGSEGEHFDLESGNLVIGREHPRALFSADPYLSPVHAQISFKDGWMTVQDMQSLNGIYIRLQGETRLIDGDHFRIGQQLLRFDSLQSRISEMRPEIDGTHQLGSPTSGLWGRLTRVMSCVEDLDQWTLTTPEVYLGRDRGTITFPEDVFVSGSHCRLRRDGLDARVSDLGSTNGTYVRIKEETALTSGDLLLLGQQLFRLELN